MLKLTEEIDPYKSRAITLPSGVMTGLEMYTAALAADESQQMIYFTFVRQYYNDNPF